MHYKGNILLTLTFLWASIIYLGSANFAINNFDPEILVSPLNEICKDSFVLNDGTAYLGREIRILRHPISEKSKAISLESTSTATDDESQDMESTDDDVTVVSRGETEGARAEEKQFDTPKSYKILTNSNFGQKIDAAYTDLMNLKQQTADKNKIITIGILMERIIRFGSCDFGASDILTHRLLTGLPITSQLIFEFITNCQPILIHAACDEEGVVCATEPLSGPKPYSTVGDDVTEQSLDREVTDLTHCLFYYLDNRQGVSVLTAGSVRPSLMLQFTTDHNGDEGGAFIITELVKHSLDYSCEDGRGKVSQPAELTDGASHLIGFVEKQNWREKEPAVLSFLMLAQNCYPTNGKDMRRVIGQYREYYLQFGDLAQRDRYGPSCEWFDGEPIFEERGSVQYCFVADDLKISLWRMLCLKRAIYQAYSVNLETHNDDKKEHFRLTGLGIIGRMSEYWIASETGRSIE